MAPRPDDPPVQAILHVGAPKCGSSALQRALSAAPVLRDAGGRRHLYLAAHQGGGRRRTRSGMALRLAALRSVHGYVAWPNVTRDDDPHAYWAEVGAAIAAQTRRDRVPILSSEGWIAHAEAAPALACAAGLEGPLDVVAFVRPPLDWLNAAYWQWGIWAAGRFHNRKVMHWLKRARYDVGPAVAAWAAQPGVRLHVDSARGDVVAGFAARYGLPLTPGDKVNPAPPPALTGFLLRNRRFRPTPHDSAVEFIIQRWCRFPPARKLWAFLPRFVHGVWPALQEDTARMMAALPPEVAERLLAEPGWTSLDAYWPRVRGGPTRLDDPEALADLFDGIAAGTGKAAAALRRRPPGQVPKPAGSAPVEAWDAAIATQLDLLMELDRRWRRRGAMRLMLGL